MSCYETFGWTPDDCKRILSRYPQEADLLALYFEELSSFRGEEYARMKKTETSDPEWHTDLVLGDEEDDED